jgi:SAM-dependent methyltransferase
MKKYVQYGCGLCAPEKWENFDASPTLRIQKVPVLGTLMKGSLNVVFPDNVRYGDIVKGLPVAENFCDGVYCSHTLEHLALNDFRKALLNTYRILKSGGIFRCVVPDLEWSAREYVNMLTKGDNTANVRFFDDTMLGTVNRPKSIKSLIASFYGNSNHLWMWDFFSLSHELSVAGFKEIRKCAFNDCIDEAFKGVEEHTRFHNALALECKK